MPKSSRFSNAIAHILPECASRVNRALISELNEFVQSLKDAGKEKEVVLAQSVVRMHLQRQKYKRDLAKYKAEKLAREIAAAKAEKEAREQAEREEKRARELAEMEEMKARELAAAEEERRLKELRAEEERVFQCSAATAIQASWRGYKVRKAYMQKMEHYKSNDMLIEKVLLKLNPDPSSCKRQKGPQRVFGPETTFQ